MKITFDQSTIDLTPNGKNYKAALDDKTVDFEVVRLENSKLDLLIDGKHVTAYVSSDGAKRWVTVNGQTCVLTKSSGARRGGEGHDHASELAAPMPGQIRSVNVSEGEAVSKGQTLLVLEAMKMEIRIQAPFDGMVKSISVSTGLIVEREQILIVVDKLEG
ncbi:MAG: biotin/lipoyl-binding protein [Chloroflexi bacterium]|nr:biotin/lipoyl-binding protein [Chloroflexota bacterium]